MILLNIPYFPNQFKFSFFRTASQALGATVPSYLASAFGSTQAEKIAFCTSWALIGFKGAPAALAEGWKASGGGGVSLSTVIFASECSACASGNYQASSAVACTACSVGLFSAARKSSSCISCAAGLYSTSTGASASSTCLPCVGVMYSAAGSSSCSACSAGSFAASAGATSCASCVVGLYNVPVIVAVQAYGYYDTSKVSAVQITTNGVATVLPMNWIGTGVSVVTLNPSTLAVLTTTTYNTYDDD